jgi:hypothetical protein
VVNVAINNPRVQAARLLEPSESFSHMAPLPFLKKIFRVITALYSVSIKNQKLIYTSRRTKLFYR